VYQTKLFDCSTLLCLTLKIIVLNPSSIALNLISLKIIVSNYKTIKFQHFYTLWQHWDLFRCSGTKLYRCCHLTIKPVCNWRKGKKGLNQ